MSDFSLNSPGMSGNILLSPTTLVKGTDNSSAIPGYPLGLSPAKSPIKGLHFSPSLFLNSPGALENSKLTSTPVLRRVQQKQHGLKTPPGYGKVLMSFCYLKFFVLPGIFFCFGILGSELH